MNGSRNQSSNSMVILNMLTHILRVEEVGGRLKNIGRMSGVVIVIGTMIVGLNQGQPPLDCVWRTTKSLRHIPPVEDLCPQMGERMMISDPLQLYHIKLPSGLRFQGINNIRRDSSSSFTSRNPTLILAEGIDYRTFSLTSGMMKLKLTK